MRRLLHRGYRIARTPAEEWPYRLRQLARRLGDVRSHVAKPMVVPRWPRPVPASPAVLARLFRTVDDWFVHGLPIPGTTVALGARDWHLDPKSDHRWSSGWSWGVDVLGGVDPRPIWSLHRLRHLQLLAWAGGNGHPQALATCREELTSWIVANPPMCGIGWASGIEVASRVVSLVWIAHCLRDQLSREAWREVQRSLGADRRMLVRHPSLASSANNHRVAELGALVLLGEVGPDAFIQVLERQMHPDGSGVEAAPAYLGVCLEWALLVRMWSGSRPDLEDWIRRAGGFLAATVDGSVTLAMGDDDGDALFADRLGHAALARSALGVGDALWDAMLGCSGIGELPRRAAHFADGGLVVHRGSDYTVWHLMGPLGLPPLAAHGHADAHSVSLVVDGWTVLTDLGTGQYLGRPDLRTYMRSAGAHNGLVVDGVDPSPQRTPFQWAPAGEEWDERHVQLEGGSSEGVYLGWNGVRHHRRVRVSSHELVIEDSVTGGRHLLVFPLHFAAGLSLQRHSDGGWRLRLPTGRVVRVNVDDTFETQRLGPGDDRCRRAPGYGQVSTGPTLWSEGALESAHRRVTRINWSPDSAALD